MSCGIIQRIILGGVDGNWNTLVVGEPFKNLKYAVEKSEMGEVVVTDICYSMLKEENEFEFEERGNNNVYLVKMIEKGNNKKK